LLNSENYVTKRQSLKLLGEVLLDRKNFSVMIKYISMPENLKLMMNLLRDKSKNIQFEAFHVFKVLLNFHGIIDLCCESKQGTTYKGHTVQEQGEIAAVFIHVS